MGFAICLEGPNGQDYMIHILLYHMFILFLLQELYIIAIFPGIILNGEKHVATKNLLLSSSCTLSLYHLHLIFIGIFLTFSPMHFLGFNVVPRRMPSFPDSFHSWNSLSSTPNHRSFGPRLSIGTTVVAWESPLKENRLGGSSHLLSN